jgi:hypothetical protein
LRGKRLAISAKMNAWSGPIETDTIQISGESVPVRTTIDPTEKSSSAGTPRAIENPSNQVRVLASPNASAALAGRPSRSSLIDPPVDWLLLVWSLGQVIRR